MVISLFVTEREREREREKQRVRPRIPRGLSAVSTEPDVGLEALNHEILT